MLARSHLAMSVNVVQQDLAIFYNRLFYEPSMIKYDSLTGRIYPGIFVKEKLGAEDFQKKLENAVYYGQDNKHIAAKIKLNTQDKELISFFNPGKQRGYEEWIILARSWIHGPGSATVREFFMPHSLYISEDDSKPKLGLFNVTAVMRNS